MSPWKNETNTRSRDLLEKRIGASRRALIVERIWPRVWPPFAVACLFVLVSLLGLWPMLGITAHKTVLIGFAVAALISFIPLVRISMPSRESAVRRLEKTSGIPHRPASAYEDTLTAPSGDAGSLTLWQAHRDRLAQMFGKLRPGSPRPRVDRRDPYALRIALVLFTVVAALLNWQTASDRFTSAFRFGPLDRGIIEARLDAWVTPPYYTRKAPIMLADGSETQKLGTDEARRFEVPEGSELIVRASGLGHEKITADFLNAASTGKTPGKPLTKPDGAKSDAAISEYRKKLIADGTLSLKVNGKRIKGWQFKVIPDALPKISLTKKPGTSARGALALSYEVEDDYGVTSADATFALTEKSRKEAGAAADDSLWPAPKFQLKLTRRNAKKVTGRSYKDLSAHPWAGMEVEMILRARDQAGQTGKSTPIVFNLPARQFRQPLARAIVEQRRNLALNPDNRRKVVSALEALTIAPEEFISDRVVYLGLRSVRWRLRYDNSREGLKSAVDQLWNVALRVEDGDLSQAERDLRNAQDKLAQALKDGASNEEISKLTQELRQALNRFLQSLAQQARRQNPDQQARRSDPNARTLSSRDLDQLLKNIEELAKSGARDSAQQMLSQLRNLLEQLQAGQQQNQQSGRMQQMMQEFGKLIREQQRLLDDTFNARRQQGQQGEQGRRGERRGERGRRGEGRFGERGRGESDRLGQRQGNLRNNLGRLLDSLQGFGGQIPTPLEGARRNMRGAEQGLEEGDLDRATQQQSQALDQLRQGARQMAEEMLRGVAGQFGRRPRDPLGRPGPLEGPDPDGGNVKVPGEIDVQKARRILKELRRRASDPNRRSLELDYIERLLERF